MTSQKANPQKIKRISPIPFSHSGADAQPITVQGLPELAEVAEGKPCTSNKGLGIALHGRNGECQPCLPTASKYNGGLLDNQKFKFIIGLDYLTLNLRGKLPIEVDEATLTNGDFKFENAVKPTKHFETLFNLYYQDTLVGTLLAYPRRGNKLNPDTIQLHIENQNFYDDTDLKSIIETFLFRFSIKYNNLTRVDVYLDSYGFQNGITLNDLDYLLDAGEIITNTRVKDKSKYSKKVENRFMTTGFTWGSRSTGRYLRIYNKTLELLHGSKVWIDEHHKLNGLVDHDVFRFEYELKNSFLKHIKNFDWSDIFSTEGQFELLDIARKGHFSFVVEDGQVRNDRKTPFPLFDWDKLRQTAHFVFDYSWKRKFPVGHSLRSVQVMVSSLLKHYVINEQPEPTLNQIKQILEQYRLKDWFEKRKDEYLKKFLLHRVHTYQFNNEKLETLWD